MESLTIVVAFNNGKFIASAPGHKSAASHLGPREGALAMADSVWGAGDHVAVCTEVHGREAKGTFLITREGGR